MGSQPNTPERIWARIDKRGPDDCWEWKGSRDGDGYGRSRYQGQAYALVPRLVWSFANEPIPEGLQVLHKCDNPPCCNPSHLFLGTNADNRADMVQKGRQAKGKQNGAYTHPERMHSPSNEFLANIASSGGKARWAKATRQQKRDAEGRYAPERGTSE